MRLAAILTLIFPVAAIAAEPSALAIRNATVETLGSAGRLDKATVVIRDGKIAAVGKDIAIPEDAVVIDTAGGTVMPGIIDPYFEVAIAAAPAADAAPRTAIVRGRQIPLGGGGPARGAAFTRIADNFYPHDAGFRLVPVYGLTRLNLVTTGSGQSAVIRVVPSQPEHMLKKPDGIAFGAVTNSSESLDSVRQRLEAARRAAGSSGRAGNAAVGTQMWADVHEGKIPLVVSAANSAAVLHLLKALEPFKKVKLVIFMGGESTPETVDAIKAHGAKVILRPGIETEQGSRDRFNAARMLNEAGIEFAFSLTAKPPSVAANAAAAAFTGDNDAPLTIDLDSPLFPVAMLVKTGLPRTKALEALSKKPAAMLGLEATHGTLKPGKMADLLLFSGDPLDPASRLRRTIIDGRTVYAN